MYGVNKSLGGASISNCRKDNTVINQLKKMEGKTFDLVILQGGANEAWDSCPVGRINDTNFDGPYNNATFAGGLEETIKYAKETFPDAKIAYIITFSMPKATYGYLSNMSGLVKMTKKVCDKWEVPYLDLYNDEDLNKNQLKTDTKECLYDYIHPNSKGYNILAPIIGEWMKTLYSPTPDESEEESLELSTELSNDESAVSATQSSDTSANNDDTKNNIITIAIISVSVVVVGAITVVLIRKKKK
jgi:lysophospholipase L1-like esterase